MNFSQDVDLIFFVVDNYKFCFMLYPVVLHVTMSISYVLVLINSVQKI